jgi:hypothetical protein
MIAFYHPTDIAIARPLAGLFVASPTRRCRSRISALPPMADIDHRRIDVRFVPTAEGKADALDSERRSSIAFGGFATAIATTCGRPSLYALTSNPM